MGWRSSTSPREEKASGKAACLFPALTGHGLSVFGWPSGPGLSHGGCNGKKSRASQRVDCPDMVGIFEYSLLLREHGFSPATGSSVNPVDRDLNHS